MEMIGKVWQSRFFSFLYIKSKPAFKPPFRTLSKLAEQLKICVQRGLKKGLYYEINFIFIIFKKLLRHQPGTQKSDANETDKRSLSKVVQRVKTTCNSIFRRFGLILVEIFAVLS